MRILCWPSRSPRNASRRFPGTAARSAREAAACMWSSFRLAILAIALNLRLCSRRKIFSVSLEPNEPITLSSIPFRVKRQLASTSMIPIKTGSCIQAPPLQTGRRNLTSALAALGTVYIMYGGGKQDADNLIPQSFADSVPMRGPAGAGPNGREERRMAQLWRRHRQHSLLGARSNQRGQFQQPPNGVALQDGEPGSSSGI